MAGLLQSLDKQNFGPNDSMIASAVRHPITGLLKAKEWLDAQMNTGMGTPYPQDEGSIYQYAPLDLARHEAALNIAGLAETGSIPFAPKSRGGILGTVTRKADDLPETEFSKAQKIAQKNAALPIEKGGLGLPENNTAMDRAKAMGFDTEAYHGTSYPGFDEFNTDGADFTKTEGTGAFFSNNPEMAASYAPEDYPGANPGIYPVKIKPGKQRVINFNGANWNDFKGKSSDDYSRSTRNLKKYDSLLMKNINDAGPGGYDIEANTLVVYDPKNIRSRFAAFDPMKKNSSNLLASGLLGSLMLNDYSRDK